MPNWAALYAICALCVWVVRPSPAEVRVVFVGNSITAGYGLVAAEAYPAVLQTYVDSLDWPVTMVNAGVSGETTAGGLARIRWLLRSHIDILVLALGGNDGLRGLPPEMTRANLIQIAAMTRSAYPEADIIVAGMNMPPNLGPEYTEAFAAVYPEVAAATGAALVPFLLESVGGIKELNQPDGIHPTAEGQRVVARNVWEILEPILVERLRER